jgi:hypothetical protein
MELLTGQPALSKDASPENEKLSEHRSVVQYVSMLIGLLLNKFSIRTRNANRWPEFLGWFK